MHSSFQHFAAAIADGVGTHRAFLIALVLVIVWAACGPLFQFSDSWQLVINTGTTVVTFLMVFLIQATQNREMRALHLKVDELVRSQKHARNIFTDLEHATDDDLAGLEREFEKVHAVAAGRQEAKRVSRRVSPPRERP